ncbi:branched-chain amino acid ABC transporter ATP-binding protein [Halogeometricum pallidum JCM 14848]|uniref:Probable branched-chain amino acid transport ATP-binding protein LivG n=1 Tax=Halogeometricum pallidum JCM 14848 TaxID=1227487 RepID=M0CZW9_HALPD|nr:ABC transporter ATP-binding protein [Halogeometricum pallidum]ELZ27962.1 branched-chain amino acid ABC transporter ATP-binding protein [Halogeometricum pallidum JCM 14848]
MAADSETSREPTEGETGERAGDPVLEADGVGKQFAGLRALEDVDMTVHRGEIVGLIGPNGAGKTTLFNCISGTFPPSEGRIYLDGQEITDLQAHQIARRGLARTFQITRPLEELTVVENAMVGAHIHTRRRSEAREIAMEQLAFVGLADRADEEAGELTVGAQKRLELARAVATRPTVLLLDEIMAGLTPSESEEMLGLFRRLRERGTSLLVIEHDMKAIMKISDYVKVLDNGRSIAFGRPKTVVENEAVIEAYVGGTGFDA